MAADRAVASPAVRAGVLLFCIALGGVAAGFLLVGEFGGWYYAEGGLRTRTVYDYDSDSYHVVHEPSGTESWGSDGLFTEATLVAPLTIALLALLGSLALLTRVLLRPAATPRPLLRRAAMLAGAASVILGGWAFVYAGSMGEVTEWWFGSAFYAGFINSTLLALVLFGLLRAKTLSGTPAAIA